MTTIFIILGFLLAGAGVLYMSEATTGAVLMAGACFCGIVARLAQAQQQHSELMSALGSYSSEVKLTVTKLGDKM